MNPRLFFKRLMGVFMRIGTPLSVLLIALAISQSINAQALSGNAQALSGNAQALSGNAQALSGNAQELSGSIAGKVKDRADAVISGAKVKIKHIETDQIYETTASQEGSFKFGSIQPGTYEINVTMSGFMAYTRSGVEVTLNKVTRSEITLDIGAVSENVSVTASAVGGPIRAAEVFNNGSFNVAQQGGDSALQFFSQESNFDNRMVKGAPFSADIVSETIQILTDGNRIVQRTEGRIFRDSQGRTRNERTFMMGGTTDMKQTITIFDPVGSVNFTLDPETRVARKTNSII